MVARCTSSQASTRPSTAAAAADLGAQPNSSQHSQFFRTKICPFHLKSQLRNPRYRGLFAANVGCPEGTCAAGDGTECRFAHSLRELRPLPDLTRTKLCASYQRQVPCAIPDCPFAHSPNDLRTSSSVFYKVSLCNFYKNNKCWNGENCRFAHGNQELREHLELMRAAAAATEGSAAVQHYPACTGRAPTNELHSHLSHSTSSRPPTQSTGALPSSSAAAFTPQPSSFMDAFNMSESDYAIAMTTGTSATPGCSWALGRLGIDAPVSRIHTRTVHPILKTQQDGTDSINTTSEGEIRFGSTFLHLPSTDSTQDTASVMVPSESTLTHHQALSGDVASPSAALDDAAEALIRYVLELDD